MQELRLSQFQASLKILISFFLIIVAIGYIFGLINIFNNTGLSYTGIVTHYRGGEELSVPPEFAFSKLIQEHHVHIFALSMLFLMVGVIFTFTSLPEWAKVVFVAAPFVGMILDMTSFWLLVFVAAPFAALAMGVGGFMAISFFLLLGRPLYEMWVLPVLMRKRKYEDLPWFLR